MKLTVATAAAILGGLWAQPALAFSPAFEISPYTVYSGQTANAYGTGYCGASGCSSVTIAVDGNQVVSGVAVGSDGKFHATFVVSQFSGSHRVTATQKAADGSTVQAAAGMMVLLADNRRSAPPTAPPVGGTPPPAVASPAPPGATPPAGVALAPSAAPSPGGGPSPPLESNPVTRAPRAAVAAAASDWPWLVGVLVGLSALGVIALLLWRRRSANQVR